MVNNLFTSVFALSRFYNILLCSLDTVPFRLGENLDPRKSGRSPRSPGQEEEQVTEAKRSSSSGITIPNRIMLLFLFLLFGRFSFRFIFFFRFFRCALFFFSPPRYLCSPFFSLFFFLFSFFLCLFCFVRSFLFSLLTYPRKQRLHHRQAGRKVIR